MKHSMVIFGMVAAASGALSGCGGDSGGAAAGAPAPASAVQSLDTAQVLVQAREPTETGDPYPVNNGALVLTDTSDTTEPFSINGA
jgi:hypothetical protein